MNNSELAAIVELTTWNYLILNPDGKSFECITDTIAGCKGAKNMLCARNISTDYRWFDFQACFQSNRWSIPGNAAECAQKAGLDQAALQQCVEDEDRTFALMLEDTKVMASMSPKVAGPDQVYINGQLVDDSPKGSTDYYRQLVCKAFKKAGGAAAPAACTDSSSIII